MDQIDKDNIPKHIAIIMDGNRRWARSRGLPELEGHKKGADTLEQVVEQAAKLGVKTITVYALSTENIRERAKREITGLFELMRTGYNTKVKKMMKNGVRVEVLGSSEGLPKIIQKIIQELKKTYIKNESIKLNIALNYGGKAELIDAIKDMVKDGVDLNNPKANQIEKMINEENLEKHLYTKGQTDPELVIRTGGKIRLSNFLLWQTAYSELYFTTKLWPDFTPEDLQAAILWYQNQQRNFGK